MYLNNLAFQKEIPKIQTTTTRLKWRTWKETIKFPENPENPYIPEIPDIIYRFQKIANFQNTPYNSPYLRNKNKKPSKKGQVLLSFDICATHWYLIIPSAIWYIWSLWYITQEKASCLWCKTFSTKWKLEIEKNKV